MSNAWLLYIVVFPFVKSRIGSLNEFTTTEKVGRGGGFPLNSFSNHGTQMEGPKQGFRCCFADRLIQSLVSSVVIH